MNDINDYYHKNHIIDDTPDNIEWKKIAVEQAVEKLMTEMTNDAKKLQKNDNDVSEGPAADATNNTTETTITETSKKLPYTRVILQKSNRVSDGPTAVANNTIEAPITEIATSLPYTRVEIERFIDALRYNLIFNIGFDVMGIHPDDEKSCLCPCCKNMIKWRQNFNIEFMTDKDACQGFHKFTTPKGLMDHLHKLGTQGGYLHRGVELYLIEMYV